MKSLQLKDKIYLLPVFVALFINITQNEFPQQKWSTVNKAQTLDVTSVYTHVSNKFHTCEEIFLICLRQWSVHWVNMIIADIINYYSENLSQFPTMLLLLFFLINLVLFKQTQEHFQPRVHGFEVGMKLEVVHPIKPSIICPATVTKSLGPYYFAITTDYQEDVPSVTFCCHSDSPGIFPAGWCSRHQVELAVPASKWKEYHQLPWRNMIIKYKSVGNAQTCFGWNLCF